MKKLGEPKPWFIVARRDGDPVYRVPFFGTKEKARQRAGDFAFILIKMGEGNRCTVDVESPLDQIIPSTDLAKTRGSV